MLYKKHEAKFFNKIKLSVIRLLKEKYESAEEYSHKVVTGPSFFSLIRNNTFVHKICPVVGLSKKGPKITIIKQNFELIGQPPITCSKLTIEIQEQGVKYI